MIGKLNHSPGRVYVMVFGKQIRIGHHAQTDKLRVAQVNGGSSNQTWTIICGIWLRSKLEAAAAEAVAHAILQEHARPESTGLKNNRMIFRCKREKAINAIKTAVQLLEKNDVVCRG